MLLLLDHTEPDNHIAAPQQTGSGAYPLMGPGAEHGATEIEDQNEPGYIPNPADIAIVDHSLFLELHDTLKAFAVKLRPLHGSSFAAEQYHRHQVTAYIAIKAFLIVSVPPRVILPRADRLATQRTDALGIFAS